MADKPASETRTDRQVRYRRNAAHVRQLAQTAPSEETRAAFLKIAQFWEELAHEEEKVT